MSLVKKLIARSKHNNANRNTINTEEVESPIEKLPRPVYYVESPNDSTVLVGIDVTIERYKKGAERVTVIDWYDTAHERRMLADEISQKGDLFAFRRAAQEGGGLYYFSPMTLDIYNNKVKKHLSPGKDYSSEEDLTKAFLDSIGNDI